MSSDEASAAQHDKFVLDLQQKWRLGSDELRQSWIGHNIRMIDMSADDVKDQISDAGNIAECGILISFEPHKSDQLQQLFGLIDQMNAVFPKRGAYDRSCVRVAELRGIIVKDLPRTLLERNPSMSTFYAADAIGITDEMAQTFVKFPQIKRLALNFLPCKNKTGGPDIVSKAFMDKFNTITHASLTHFAAFAAGGVVSDKHIRVLLSSHSKLVDVRVYQWNLRMNEIKRTLDSANKLIRAQGVSHIQLWGAEVESVPLNIRTVTNVYFTRETAEETAAIVAHAAPVSKLDESSSDEDNAE